MSVVPGPTSQVARSPKEAAKAERPTGALFELDGVDLSACAADRDQIAELNPHRGAMALLDKVVWWNEDITRAIAIKHVRDDEFWVEGHFPKQPMLPGVLMVEAGAQLASFMYQQRRRAPGIGIFLRIDEATFRSMVMPGNDLVILGQEVKFGPRRFTCDTQGLVDGKIAFSARITGMLREIG